MDGPPSLFAHMKSQLHIWLSLNDTLEASTSFTLGINFVARLATRDGTEGSMDRVPVVESSRVSRANRIRLETQ